MSAVAAIDVGTNTVRLLVASPSPGGYEELARLLTIPRLGHDVDANGRLDLERIQKTVAAVAGYVVTAHELGAKRIRIAATSAVRDASNREVFLDAVLAATDVRPDVLSGDEEAALAFAGASTSFSGERLKVVIDIGGGSTEMVAGRDRVLAARSVDIGSVRLTERHLRADLPSESQVRAARTDAASALDASAAHIAGVCGGETPIVIGVAGTFTTLTALSLGLTSYDRARVHKASLSLPDVTTLGDRLALMPVAERAANPVITPGRADAIVAGAILAQEAMRSLGVQAVTVSETDILDGLLISLL